MVKYTKAAEGTGIERLEILIREVLFSYILEFGNIPHIKHVKESQLSANNPSHCDLGIDI